MAALEVYVRRSYTAYSVISVRHDEVSIGWSCGIGVMAVLAQIGTYICTWTVRKPLVVMMIVL